ncbi:hypothetical protein [Burkholderia cepacia]|uniref:hypothetical protein n=1 Tax=Burkholderia cepacia TaxID=292 RepID=UPI002AB7AAB4|nr:hypothetical protein [Burkholderia cepacia]
MTIATLRGGLGRFGRIVRGVLGGLLVAVGALVVSGTDKALQALLLSQSPDWLAQLTTSLLYKEIDMKRWTNSAGTRCIPFLPVGTTS